MFIACASTDCNMAKVMTFDNPTNINDESGMLSAIAERGNRSGYPERSGKWNDSLNKLKFLGITRGWMRSDLLLADSPKTFLS